MKVRIEWTSAHDYEGEIKEFANEKELLDYCFEQYDRFIISKGDEDKGVADLTVEFYDDYRE